PALFRVSIVNRYGIPLSVLKVWLRAEGLLRVIVSSTWPSRCTVMRNRSMGSPLFLADDQVQSTSRNPSRAPTVAVTDGASGRSGTPAGMASPVEGALVGPAPSAFSAVS